MSLAGEIFSNRDNGVGDVIRLFVIFGGVVMFGMILKVARDVRNTRQYAMYTLVCLGTASIGTEIEQLGQIVTYRLVLNCVGVIFGIIFLAKTFRFNRREAYRDKGMQGQMDGSYRAGEIHQLPMPVYIRDKE